MPVLSRKLRSIVVFFTVAGLSVLWNLQERRLRFAAQAENEVLRAEGAKAESKIVELNNQLEKAKEVADNLQKETIELPKLRGEIVRLRAQSVDARSNQPAHPNAPARTSPGTAGESDAESLLRNTTFETWIFSGYNTPENTLQSTAWAMTQGNVQTLLAGADPAMQQRLMATVVDNTEEEATEFVKKTGLNIAQVHLKRKQMISDDEVKFTLTGERPDGHSFDVNMRMKLIGGEWKYVGDR